MAICKAETNGDSRHNHLRRRARKIKEVTKDKPANLKPSNLSKVKGRRADYE